MAGASLPSRCMQKPVNAIASTKSDFSPTAMTTPTLELGTTTNVNDQYTNAGHPRCKDYSDRISTCGAGLAAQAHGPLTGSLDLATADSHHLQPFGGSASGAAGATLE